MALSKIQSESMNLADTFAFTGTVSGVGALKKIQYIPIPPKSITGANDLIPLDNTLPLITEGHQVVQANYTPAETSSTIFVDATFRVGEDSNVSNSFTAALFFNDTCVNVRNILGVGNRTTWQRLQASFTNTTGSALDIEIRCDQKAEYEINGQYFSTSSTAYEQPTTSTFGGTDAVNQTYITVTEF